MALAPRSSAVVWLLVLCGADTALARSRVVVRVTDASSGRPVENAVVVLPDTDIGPVSTNAVGEAAFQVEAVVSPRPVVVSRPDAYLEFERSIVVKDGEAEVRLKPNRDLSRDLSVRGRAVGLNGAPLMKPTKDPTKQEPATVWVSCGITRASGTIEEDGGFFIEHLAPGPCEASLDGVAPDQFFTLSSREQWLEFGPRVDDVVVSVQVPGATEVYIVRGNISKPARHCDMYCNCTGGVSDYIPSGLPCVPEKAGRFVCPPVSAGVHTVTAFHTNKRSVIEWDFEQWGRVVTVGKTPLTVKLPAFELPPPKASEPRIRAIHPGCEWP